MANTNTVMPRALGLKEAISMTVGTVVGVGLFTCGSAQVGKVGPYIIVLTAAALLISIWPCLLYGEMSSALPCAGGTYNYSKRGLNRLFANLVGWHYIISVVAIGAGETLAFANYFKILLEQFHVNLNWDSRIIAVILVTIFLFLNLMGIEFSGKAQTGFIFFFWGGSLGGFLYMIPKIHISYFGGFAMDQLPPFKEIMYIFGLVWWCYTGFETCVSMGSETKFPQYTLPRALKVSVFIVFICTALFQWYLCGIVPHSAYSLVAAADAPYAAGLKAAGLTGFPIILLCIGIAFGGDLSTINPGIAAPARYIYTMAEDGALPKWFGKIHPKWKTPYTAVITVGIINYILIATGSINYIASVSLVSLAICYMIACASYIGLKKKYADMKRPYVAPAGKAGAVVTIILYAFMLVFADRTALITAAVITVLSILYWALVTRKLGKELPTIEEEVGIIEEPTPGEKVKLDKSYRRWKVGTIIAFCIVVALYLVPIIAA